MTILLAAYSEKNAFNMNLKNYKNYKIVNINESKIDNELNNHIQDLTSNNEHIYIITAANSNITEISKYYLNSTYINSCSLNSNGSTFQNIEYKENKLGLYSKKKIIDMTTNCNTISTIFCPKDLIKCVKEFCLYKEKDIYCIKNALNNKSIITIKEKLVQSFDVYNNNLYIIGGSNTYYHNSAFIIKFNCINNTTQTKRLKKYKKAQFYSIEPEGITVSKDKIFISGNYNNMNGMMVKIDEKELFS